MKVRINPGVATVIVIVAIIGFGLIGWKLFLTPQGLHGKIPASYSTPNSGGPPKPSNAPRVAP